MSLYSAGGTQTPGPRTLQVWGVEGALFSLLNRPKQ
jgi:hypothetical protein